MECTHCEGTGMEECGTPWCTDEDHGGSCSFCAGTGEMEN